jgi:hypothetical protein
VRVRVPLRAIFCRKMRRKSSQSLGSIRDESRGLARDRRPGRQGEALREGVPLLAKNAWLLPGFFLHGSKPKVWLAGGARASSSQSSSPQIPHTSQTVGCSFSAKREDLSRPGRMSRRLTVRGSQARRSTRLKERGNGERAKPCPPDWSMWLVGGARVEIDVLRKQNRSRPPLRLWKRIQNGT